MIYQVRRAQHFGAAAVVVADNKVGAFSILLVFPIFVAQYIFYLLMTIVYASYACNYTYVVYVLGSQGMHT